MSDQKPVFSTVEPGISAKHHRLTTRVQANSAKKRVSLRLTAVFDTLSGHLALRGSVRPHAEYIIPTTVPSYMPSWARWGLRVDLADWNNYEIYEVEPYDIGNPHGHGLPQVKRYLDELNNAYGGIGIGLVHDWNTGTRVGPIDFLTLDGLLQVNA